MLLRYIEHTCEKFAEFEVKKEDLAFYGLIRWKLLQLLSKDCETAGTSGRQRTQSQYAAHLMRLYVDGEYHLEHNLLFRLSLALGLAPFEGQAVYELTVKDFEERIKSVLENIFSKMNRFYSDRPSIIELLDVYKEERQRIAEVIEEDPFSQLAKQAIKESRRLFEDGPQASGMTNSEIKKTVQDSGKRFGVSQRQDWGVVQWSPDNDDIDPEEEGMVGS